MMGSMGSVVEYLNDDEILFNNHPYQTLSTNPSDPKTLNNKFLWVTQLGKV